MSQTNTLRQPNRTWLSNRTRVTSWLLVAALTVTQVAGLFALSPAVVQAQEASPQQATATTDQEIVYLDPEGYIRVLDPFVPDERQRVEWHSPTGNWQQFALGDVNGDGDMEIIAVSEINGVITLTVFDPVAASGSISDPGRVIAGIPWDILYEHPLIGGLAPIVAAGNFDTGIAADEIFIGYREYSGVSRGIILNAEGSSIDPATQRPTGRQWKVHVETTFDAPFSHAEVGDITNNGADDLILVESPERTDGAFQAYEAQNNFNRLGRVGQSNTNFNSLAVGQVLRGGGAEIVVSSEAGSRNNLRLIRRESNGEFTTHTQERFLPTPEYVFLADLTGNGDQKVFFLRSYDGDDRARIVLLNEWGTDSGTGIADFEHPLDSDSGYKVGVGVDSNGDGRDEVAIMRNNRIRLYTRPIAGPSEFTDFNVTTNSRNIRAGNLDAIGFVEGPQITFSPDFIEVSANRGTTSAPVTVNVANIGTTESVQIGLSPVTSAGLAAAYVNVTPISPNTPASFNLTFNTSGLSEGTHTGVIRISSPNTNVVNLPAEIPFSFTVLPPGFSPTIGGTGFFYYRCTDYFDTADEEEENNDAEQATLHLPTAPQTATVRFEGFTGPQVSMAVVEAPISQTAGSAETAATGPDGTPVRIVDAFVNDEGDVVILDAEGGRTVVEMANAQTAAADDFSWPAQPEWVTSVRSDTNTVPFEVTLVGDVYPLLRNLDDAPTYLRRSALLVVIGDETFGAPPRNVRLVPITLTCTNSFLGMPLISTNNR